MKREALKAQEETNAFRMTLQNLKICLRNQEGYETPYLNDALQLQYYSFSKIKNLQIFVRPNSETSDSSSQPLQKQEIQINKGVNTVYLNNNVLQVIQNLSPLKSTLITLNLSHNRISKFEGLKELHILSVLDLSFNKINSIQKEQIQSLIHLKRLNLSYNGFEKKQQIQAVTSIGSNLQILELRNNQKFNSQIDLISDVFAYMKALKILILKDTPFARMTKSYRKQILLTIESLTFLDQRPITEDERVLAKAWKKGGLNEERQARKLINQKKQEKNIKIMQDIEQRNRLVSQKVEAIFQLKAKNPLQQLQDLKQFRKTEDFQFLTSQEQSIHNLKVEELEEYLKLFKQQCKTLDLDKQLGLSTEELPRMLIEKRTPQCIYIYNIKEDLLDKIRQKYYPNQNLPLKVINYQKTKQLEWIRQYDDILLRDYSLCKGNWELIVPSFNMDVYEYDLNSGRKLRRFTREVLEKKHKEAVLKEVGSNTEQSYEQSHYVAVNAISVSNQLNCLD